MSDRGPFVLVDGANELAGLRALAWVAIHWRALRRDMTRTPGYIAHRVWFALPLTIGLTSWWESERAAYDFARSHGHRMFWRWGSQPGHTRGGWLAFYRYDHGGPLWGNGVAAMVSRLGGRVGRPSGRPPRQLPSDLEDREA